MLSDRAKHLALQAIIYFVLCKAQGKTRSEAVHDFVHGKLCREFGPDFTVGMVYGLAQAGGYE